MNDVVFFNPYLKQHAAVVELADGKYWLKHADDGTYPIGFSAVTMLIGTPASLLHPSLPEGQSVKKLAYEVIERDSNGFEYTGWVLYTQEPVNHKDETAIRETAGVVRPIGCGPQ